MYLDVERWLQYLDRVKRLTVWFNGRDVTARCRKAADGYNGRVTLLCGDEDNHRDWQKIGPAHVAPDAWDLVCELELRGHVEIRSTDA